MASRLGASTIATMLIAGCGETLGVADPTASPPPQPPPAEVIDGGAVDGAPIAHDAGADVVDAADAARPDAAPDPGRDRGDGGALVWDRRLGEPTADLLGAYAVAAPNGDVVVSARFEGTIALGGDLLTSDGPSYRNVFLARLDPTGAYQWARGFNASGVLSASAHLVDATGIWMSGFFAQTVDVGGGQLASTDAMADGLLARRDPNGGHLWSKRFGEGGGQSLEARARIGSDIVVAGVNGGSIDLGGGPLVGANFLSRLDGATGAHVWSRQTATGRIFWKGISTDSSGNVFVAADLGGAVDWGNGALTSAGESDVYVAKLDPAGAMIWQKRFGTADRQSAAGIAAAPDGSVYVVGATSGPIDFGGGPLTPVYPAPGLVTTFLTKLASDGSVLWAKIFSTTAFAVESYPAGVAVDSGGNVMIVGTAGCGLDFGAGKVPAVEHPARTDNVYVAKFDPSGVHLWSRGWAHLGAPKPSTMFDARGISVDASGNAIITMGAREVTVDLGGGPHTVATLDNFLVAKLAP